MLKEDTKLVPIGYRAPRYLVNDFKKLFPDRGKRTKLIKGLIQMLTDGRIKAADIKYFEKL